MSERRLEKSVEELYFETVLPDEWCSAEGIPVGTGGELRGRIALAGATRRKHDKKRPCF